MYSAEQRQALRNACTLTVPGHARLPPGEELIRIGEWCKAQGFDADVYGSGKLIQSFETRIAGLLGLEAAVFMPSGAMAQQIAARIHCERAGNARLGMHPTCHVEIHEQRGYAATSAADRGSTSQCTRLRLRERPLHSTTDARD